MPRLIDADRLLSDKMKSKYYHLKNGDIAIPIIDIEHAPTVSEEQETVIRCRECKYFIGEGYYCKIRGMGRALKQDDFCSDGERKKGR